MRFFTLGTLDLRTDRGERVQALLAQPKRVALLAYLAAAQPGTTPSRDTLYGVFWPELSEDRARHALSQALYAMRRALGANVVVAGQGRTIALAADGLWCDVVAFRAALDAGDYAQALDLYRGDLLTGFFASGLPEFERWLDLARERYRQRAATAAWALAQAVEEQGRPDTAAYWARRAVDLSPDDELALRRLLTLLQRLGDRAGAARVYEDFASRLAAEFQLEPSPETERLMESIRRTVPARVVAARPQARPPQSHTSDPTDVPDRLAESPVARTRRGGVAHALWYASAALLSAALLVVAVGHVPRGQREALAPGLSDTAAAMEPARARADYLSRLGRFFWAKRSASGLATAIHYFALALEADSAYAPAYSGLADSYVLLAWYGNADPRAVASRARRAAIRAIELGPNLAEAHASLAAVFAWIDRDGRRAEAEYKRAMLLDPRYATAHEWYAFQLAARGRLDSALAEAAAARALDPGSLPIGADLATMLFWTGRYEAAIVELRMTLALDSTFGRAHAQLWRVYAAAGRHAEAVDELQRVMRAQGVPAQARRALRRAYADRGWEGVLTWRLRMLAASAHREPARPVELAWLSAALGRRDQALAWLKQARAEQNEYLPFARLDPAFASLRSDPRFDATVSE
jgi:DNA-binding SARP family transcriptional activator